MAKFTQRPFVKALLLVSWLTPVWATTCVALMGALALLSLPKEIMGLGVALLVVAPFALPLPLLIYILTSARIGVGLHIFTAVLLSLLAAWFCGFMLIQFFGPTYLSADQVRSTCVSHFPLNTDLPKIQMQTLVCAISTWWFFVRAAFLGTLVPGVVLFALLAVWRRFHRRPREVS